MALKGVEIVKLASFPKDGERTLIEPAEDPWGSDIDTDDDPLVSGPATPVTVPIGLVIQSSGRKANLPTLLDAGCTGDF